MNYFALKVDGFAIHFQQKVDAAKIHHTNVGRWQPEPPPKVWSIQLKIDQQKCGTGLELGA